MEIKEKKESRRSVENHPLEAEKVPSERKDHFTPEQQLDSQLARIKAVLAMANISSEEKVAQIAAIVENK